MSLVHLFLFLFYFFKPRAELLAREGPNERRRQARMTLRDQHTHNLRCCCVAACIFDFQVINYELAAAGHRQLRYSFGSPLYHLAGQTLITFR